MCIFYILVLDENRSCLFLYFLWSCVIWLNVSLKPGVYISHNNLAKADVYIVILSTFDIYCMLFVELLLVDITKDQEIIRTFKSSRLLLNFVVLSYFSSKVYVVGPIRQSSTLLSVFTSVGCGEKLIFFALVFLMRSVARH